MERREHARYDIWFPVQIAPTGAFARAILAVSKDASSGGISISAPQPFDKGVRVRVTFRVPADTGEERHADGTVVRVEPNPDDPQGLWPHRMGISFDEPIAELDALLRTVTDSA